MGLDARVNCDCFRRGKLREAPLPVWEVYETEDGSIESGAADLDMQMEFDQWRFSRACEHEDCVLLHHRIGNASTVAFLRSELERKRDMFPILLGKVLYSGIHAGDWLSLEDVRMIESELDHLASFECSSLEANQFVDVFANEMRELVSASHNARNPIVF